MSKALINSALGGMAVAGAVAIAVATGLFDLDGEAELPVERKNETSAQDAGRADAVQDATEQAAAKEAEPGMDDVGAATPSQPASVAIETDHPVDDPEQAETNLVSKEREPAPPAASTMVAEDTDTQTSSLQPDAAAKAPKTPSFDTVRAEPGGSTLIAGAGEPGGEVEVMVNGAAASTARIGADGKFVAFLDLPSEGKASRLTLRMMVDGTPVMSARDVIVAPTPTASSFDVASASPDAPQGGESGTAGGNGSQVDTTALGANAVNRVPAAMPSPDGGARAAPVPQAGQAPDAPAETGSGDAPTAGGAFSAPRTGTVQALSDAPKTGSSPDLGARTDEAPQAQTAPSGSNDTALALAQTAAPAAPAGPVGTEVAQSAPAPQPTVEAPAAPTVLVAGPGGVDVLGTAPLEPGEVALDTISYDTAGDVLLAGRGGIAGFVRVYLDNSPITASRIRDDGRWRVELPDVDTGTYTLRVDQVDESGTVIARVESPFLREDPALLEELARGDGPISEITVQPGHTLWEISEDRYGHGIEYVKIFRANKDRIRNPDLIYPGQIFDLPEPHSDIDAAAASE